MVFDLRHVGHVVAVLDGGVQVVVPGDAGQVDRDVRVLSFETLHDRFHAGFPAPYGDVRAGVGGLPACRKARDGGNAGECGDGAGGNGTGTANGSVKHPVKHVSGLLL